MPPRNDPPKKFSKLLYFRGLFCQTQSQTPLLAPPIARHTESFPFSPPCKLGEICRRPSGAVDRQGVPCVRVPSGAVDRQGVPCARVPSGAVDRQGVPCSPRAVWCRGSSGRAMCPRAVLVPWIVRACHVSACRLVPWHRSGRAMSSHTYIYIIRYEKHEKHEKQRKNKKNSLFLENNLFFVW